MSTVIRNTISKKNKYYIEKHRYLELKHFCLQYPKWKEEYHKLEYPIKSMRMDICKENTISDQTGDIAVRKSKLFYQMKIIEQAAINADPELASYILFAVTTGKSFEYLETMQEIPCCRQTYYDRYRRFFWLLDKER